MKNKLLEIIKVEVAQNGCVTSKAMRIYIENRISKKAFDNAISEGLKIYERNKN